MIISPQGMLNMKRRAISSGLAGFALLGSIAAPSVHAMQFADHRLNNGMVVISGVGEIATGDSDRLISVLVTLPPNEVHVLALNSSGGSVVASQSLAATIRQFKLGVFVGNTGVCASACFIPFAASSAKFYVPGAHIGIHSATGAEYETPASMAMTTVMARTVAEMGVPDAIVGRMIRTPPGSIAWLGDAELASMGAKRIDLADATPSAPVAPIAPAPPVASLPNSSVPATGLEPRGKVPVDQSSPGFQQGLADRTAWERWFAGLGGDAQQGADYWTGERSKRRPGSCSVGTPEFQRGCLAAKQLLATPDVRRKADPQYWWGWNSYNVPAPAPVAAVSPPAPVGAPSPSDAECPQRFGVVCPPYMRR